MAKIKMGRIKVVCNRPKTPLKYISIKMKIGVSAVERRKDVVIEKEPSGGNVPCRSMVSVHLLYIPNFKTWDSWYSIVFLYQPFNSAVQICCKIFTLGLHLKLPIPSRIDLPTLILCSFFIGNEIWFRGIGHIIL